MVVPTEIRGWCATHGENGGAANVDIFIDGEFYATVAGIEYREDLKTAGVAGGFAAFVIETPAALLDGREHTVHACFRGTDEHLVGSPRTFRHTEEAVDNRHWIEKFSSYLVEAESNLEQRRLIERDFADRDIKKVAVFVGFSMKPRPLSHSQQLIWELKKHGYYVVHIHAAGVTQGLSGWGQLSDAHCSFLKHNIGYDFGSWLAGIALVAPWLESLDELLLINDSSIGPIFSFEDFLDESRLDDCDIYGIIDSYDIQYHLQSYCLRFGKAPLRNGLIARFAEQYPITQSKAEIVRAGEIGLSELALDQGYTLKSEYSFEAVRDKWLANCGRYKDDAVRAICDAGFTTFSSVAESIETKFEEIRSGVMFGAPLNPTHYFWRTLCEDYSFPLLKRDLLLKNPAGIPDWHLIPSVFERFNPASKQMIKTAYRESGGLVPFFPKQQAMFKASNVNPSVVRTLAAAQV